MLARKTIAGKLSRVNRFVNLSKELGTVNNFVYSCLKKLWEKLAEINLTEYAIFGKTTSNNSIIFIQSGVSSVLNRRSVYSGITSSSSLSRLS